MLGKGYFGIGHFGFGYFGGGGGGDVVEPPPPDQVGELFGPALLSGAALSSLPISSIGHLPVPPSDEPTPFDLAVIAAEVNLITLVKLELTSSGSA